MIYILEDIGMISMKRVWSGQRVDFLKSAVMFRVTRGRGVSSLEVESYILKKLYFSEHFMDFNFSE